MKNVTFFMSAIDDDGNLLMELHFTAQRAAEILLEEITAGRAAVQSPDFRMTIEKPSKNHRKEKTK